MDDIDIKVVFLVGVGAPASLYKDYLDNLKKHLPKAKVFVLEWWNQEDFGISQLQSYIGNSEVMLIGHSAGSVIALQALMKWPAFVTKIVMLDSHFQRSKNALPTVSRMLEVMLSNNKPSIKNKIETAYAPHIDDASNFNKALSFAIEWVNTSFDSARNLFNVMPAHSALLIGFTNMSYRIMSSDDETTLTQSWKNFNVDVKSIPMNHFDLIDARYGESINQLIRNYVCKAP